MLFLLGDVIGNRINIRGTNRKHPIPCLPCEIRQLRNPFLDPETRSPLEFLDPIRLGDGPAVAGEKMHMVFHSSDKNGRAFELVGDSPEE